MLVESIILMLILQVKHCYADFVLQTYMQTVKKGVWLHPVGISHTLDHMYCSLIGLMLFSLFVTLNPFIIIWTVVVEGIVHYVVDYSKVKYGCKDNTKPIFWTQFGLDQLAHQVTYIGMIWVLLR
jgi:hypothetical protein